MELERIIQLKGAKLGSLTDKHLIEVAHSGEISCYLLVENSLPDLLTETVGDIVYLNSTHFPAIVSRVEEAPFKVSRSRDLIFSTIHKGLGLPYIVPLRYEFPEKETYRAQKYGRVLLPFSPNSSQNQLRRDQIRLAEEVTTIEIGGVQFESSLKDLCRNKWDKAVPILSGTV